MTKSIYFFVYCSLFLDITISFRNISFWLIIIIIRNKIMNRILRKKFFKLKRKLSSKSFVMCNYKCWFLNFLNNICHCKCFSTSSNSPKSLEIFSIRNIFHYFVNSLLLIRTWRIFWFQIKFILSHFLFFYEIILLL